jgi:cyclase
VEAVKAGGASAAAAGSMFVFQGRHRAVLVNTPAEAELRAAFAT